MFATSDRPQTRRGLSEQNPNNWDDQPMETSESSAGNAPSSHPPRPLTRMGSEYAVPKTGNIAARISSSMRPPTSSFGSDGIGPRIAAGINRPGSRLGTSVPNARIPTSMPHMAAADRPTTQQGLGGLKTAARGLPQRQIQDKSYYLSLLRAKMTELNNEMLKLNKGIEKNNKEVQSLPSLEKKVKEMAMEITELQGQAADLNVLQEKISTSSDVSQMESELQSLLIQNEREAREVEQILDDVKAAKERLTMIEREIQLEEDNAEKFVTTLSLEDQERYNALKNEQDRLTKEVENHSTQLDELESRSRKLEEELRPFPLKEEMFRLRQAQAELETKYQIMKEQDTNRLSSEDERAQLLVSVKSDNAEVAAMEQQINELSAHTERLQNDLKEVAHSYEESQSERGQKYRDLRKREEVMDEFLTTFETNYNEEKSRLDAFENQIASTLTKVSKQHSLMQLVPSITDYNNTKEDLVFKEGELEKSRSTLEGVAIEYQRMQTNLQKMEDLESKINEELTTLKEQLSNIDANVVKFSNVEELKKETEEKRNAIIMEQSDLSEKKNELRIQVERLQEECDQLQAELDRNETHATLRTLDEKLRLLEEDNKSTKSYIEEHKNKNNVSQRRDTTLSVVQEYLKSLEYQVS